MIKRLLLSALLISSQLFADTIVLKSGRKIECESVVEQATQIQCVMGRSTIAFQKTQVASVTKSSAPAKPAAPPTVSKPEPRPSKSADETDRMNRALGFTKTGIARLKQKQFSAAIQSFQDAYDTYRNKDTVSNLAVAYFYSENYDSAQSYFQELLTLHPDDAMALEALGIIAAIKGDTQAADNYWRQSYAIKPDPMILTYLKSLSQPGYAPSGEGKMALSRPEMEKTIASYDEDSETHFHIRYDGGSVNPELLRGINRTLEDQFEKLRFAFEVEPTNTLEVVLYPKKDFLSITGAPDWSGGFNDGRIHLPVGGLDTVNREVEAVITHELTHSFVLTKTNGHSPIWLQEGVAQYMEGSRLNGSASSGLASLYSSGALPSLNQMSSSFMGANTSQATVYYAASLSFIQYLMNRYRFDEMNEMLRKLGSGESTDDAVREALGARLGELEDDWHSQLK